ncbi:MAG: polysaccharide deacetylase family protein [Desulfotalea sp.]
MTKKKYLLNVFFSQLPFTAALLRAFSRIIHRNSITILNYHLVTDEISAFPDWCNLPLLQFTEQMKYLANHYDVIHLSEAITVLQEGKQRERPIAVITFDDGFKNNCDLALPVLKKENLPATIFLTTNFIDSDNILWFGKLHDALSSSTKTDLNWNNMIYNITTPEDKSNTYRDLQKRLKKYHHSQLLEEVDYILSQLDDTSQNSTNQATSTYEMLDKHDIHTMLKSGLIEFGAHTSDHAILSKLSTEEQKEQIQKSISTIEELTGKIDIAFAYPNGTPQDYSSTTIKELIEANATCAMTTQSGFNYKETNIYELKRIGVGSDWNIGSFIFAMHTGITK